MENVVRAVLKGLERAKKDLNNGAPDNELTFEYGIILCALRRFNRQMSPYYERVLSRGKGSTPQSMASQADPPASKGDDRTRTVLFEVRDQLREILTLMDKGAKKVH